MFRNRFAFKAGQLATRICHSDLVIEYHVPRAAGAGRAYSALTQEWPLVAGRQFAEGEARGGRAVCVLGQTVVQRLFGAAEPLGQIIRVKNVACEVIGVLDVKGQSSTGVDQDDVILMPLRVFQRRLAGNNDIGTIMISANDGVDTGRVQVDVELLLRNISAGVSRCC